MSPDVQALRDHLGGAACIIWDLDNTLYDQRDYDRGAFMEIGRALAPKDEAKAEELAAFLLRRKAEMGPHYRELFNDVLALVTAPALTVGQCVGLYHGHEGRLMSPERSLAPLLRILGSRARMAVVSNGRAATQLRKIARLGLTPLLTAVVVADPADSIFALKPDPAAWTWLAQQHDFAGAVMVGDDEAIDGGFARNAGIGYIPFRFTADGSFCS